MEKLVGRNALGLSDANTAAVHTVSGLFRAPSIASAASSELCHFQDPDSDGSDSSVCYSSTRRIALAKAVLAEACAHGYTSSYVQTSSFKKTDKCMNAGALGPLLALLQGANDGDKCCCCLDTLAFLLLDRTNRRTVNDLHGVDILLQVLHKFQDPTVQTKALDALKVLVNDNADKGRLWQNDNKASFLGLISLRQPTPQLLELLSFAKNLAFHMDGSVPLQLMHPQLISAAASLLHPLADAAVLHKALHVLLLASRCAEPAQLAAWNNAIFKLVPLLTRPLQAARGGSDPVNRSSSGTTARQAQDASHGCILEAALQPLLNLSDNEVFRNALFAAGCIAPMLALLSHRSSSICIMATSVIANLAESGFSRQQLSRELPLHALLCCLKTVQSSEVIVGLLYILGRLASCSNQVVAILRQYGAIPLLQELGHATTDADAVLGVQQLLGMLGSSMYIKSNPAALVRTAVHQAAAAASQALEPDADLQVHVSSSQARPQCQPALKGVVQPVPGLRFSASHKQQLGVHGHHVNLSLAHARGKDFMVCSTFHVMSTGMCV